MRSNMRSNNSNMNYTKLDFNEILNNSFKNHISSNIKENDFLIQSSISKYENEDSFNLTNIEKESISFKDIYYDIYNTFKNEYKNKPYSDNSNDMNDLTLINNLLKVETDISNHNSTRNTNDTNNTYITNNNYSNNTEKKTLFPYFKNTNIWTCFEPIIDKTSFIWDKEIIINNGILLKERCIQALNDQYMFYKKFNFSRKKLEVDDFLYSFRRQNRWNFQQEYVYYIETLFESAFILLDDNNKLLFKRENEKMFPIKKWDRCIIIKYTDRYGFQLFYNDEESIFLTSSESKTQFGIDF